MTPRIECTGTSNTLASSHIMPECPHCASPVHAIRAAPDYEDAGAFGAEEVIRVEVSYELSPCGHSVQHVYIRENADGNRAYYFTPSVQVQMTPQLKKIREALGL